MNTNTLDISIPRTVKIRRNSERFWLNNVFRRGDKLVGRVNNHTVNQVAQFGDRIEFSEDEIIEIWEE